MSYSIWAIIWLAGVLVGRFCEGNRWMKNANRIQRIEWRGSLFKVARDE